MTTPKASRSTWAVAGGLFPRALAVVYVVAFISLALQITALAGHDGILPAQQYLDVARGQLGMQRFWIMPTIFWWTGAEDATLRAACWGGAAVAAVVASGFLPLPGLALAWVLYLSLCVVCRTFLNFQWDALLLEAGFLALFVAPPGLRCRVPCRPAPPRFALFLIQFLLFRLMFSSGMVKLTSGDPTWWQLRALDVHYFTQPIPWWTAWYAQQLPAWFQTLSCALMFVCELLVPFLIFAPHRSRHAAGAVLLGFQVLIAGTGNFAFFNLLTMALCVVLFDDSAWPRRLSDRFLPSQSELTPEVYVEAGPDPHAARRWPRWIAAPLVVILVTLSTAAMAARWRVPLPWPKPLVTVIEAVQPFRIVNAYGLFAVMTTTREEIVVEGSDDGEHWKAYEFKWKPGDVMRRPPLVAPHQPRVDWQMWFAALSEYRRQPWFSNFLARLLQGSPEVLALMARNPFPLHPPMYIRSVLYDYHFTTIEERRATGAWWVREGRGLYSPPQSLRQ
jgi:lipase maturation factor 1